MARLGDLLKIQTDSYKRLEVVECYDKYIIVRNSNINYAVKSDRKLKGGDILHAAVKVINKGDTIICNQNGKDYVVTIKILTRWNEASSDFKKIIRSIEKEIWPLTKQSDKKNNNANQNIVSKNKPLSKLFIQPINKNGDMPTEYYNMKEKASATSKRAKKSQYIKIISIPMGGQNKRYN